MSKQAIVLTDGKAGHEGQSLAFCRLAGLEPVCVPVRFTARWRKLAAVICDRLGLAPALATLAGDIPDAPACVVGTGSTTWYAVKRLARQLNVPSVAILMPRGYRLDFDLILAPEMDQPPQRPNLVALPINLCDVRPEALAGQLAEFANRHRRQRPAVGFVVGGDSKACRLSADAVTAAVTAIRDQFPDHEYWLTTSRRTDPALEARLRAFHWDYACWYSVDKFNPIPAFIEDCDRICVTSDSASMLSECVSRGAAAVTVIRADHLNGEDKFCRQIRYLEKLGAVSAYEAGRVCAEARKKIDLAPLVRSAARKIGVLDD